MMKNQRAGVLQRTFRRGATAVEFAVVLPVFLTITFGLLEASRLHIAYNSAQVAALEGARTLSLPQADADDVKANVVATLEGLGYSKTDIEVTTEPALITDATIEVEVSVQLTIHPLERHVAYSTTRTRETAGK